MGEVMKSLKKLGLVLSAIAFCLCVSAASAYAQPGKAKYEGNRGLHKGWEKGKHYGWEKRDKRADHRLNRSTRQGRLSSEELSRLSRQGTRLERLEDRLRRDGSLSGKDRRKLNKKYTKYNHRITRARNN